MIEFGQLALVEDQDFVSVCDGCLQTVRNHQDRRVLAMLEEVLQHAFLGRSIDLRGRLVQEDELRAFTEEGRCQTK